MADEDSNIIRRIFNDIMISAAYMYNRKQAERRFLDTYLCSACATTAGDTCSHFENAFRKHWEALLPTSYLHEDGVIRRFEEETG
jgi:hypothetical protein